MNAVVHLKTISDLYRVFQIGQPLHPLVAVIDFSQVDEQLEPNTKIATDFYSVMFKNYCKNLIRYGRKTVDFQDGSLICIAPNQVIELDNEVEVKDNMLGWGLFFHPDLIRATSLNDKLKDYSFFTYEIAEALHLSAKETNTLYDCVKRIETELRENIDVHSQHIIVSTIELLLNYCSRFYGRQMITRTHTHKTVVAQIETLLQAHFLTNQTNERGLPTVKYLADQVHLSPGYLSDLLKKETGKNAQAHIHYYLIEAAKNSLISTDQSVNEIAFKLGFEYPQYFNKLFKQKTGRTPLEFRSLN
ncbi:helix-turn-helix domain-containing protein [Rudanella paleaurantiibacter]|uniref:Helix-turn-helix domain-containing protein n=1 Tax=Rudanella paleaurantiibacter TaxID=2614655 RepID=A0A7J5U0K3_9BACT|nr:response regulator transcription factor [Rudanella paleaurantiibacter]KAB7731220.1 helix-turn-helix domain-containing protein [Rudanella paleaurantiibacter]